MKEGLITVIDKTGDIIWSANIWLTLWAGVFTGTLRPDPREIRVYVDGEEFSKPDVLKERT